MFYSFPVLYNPKIRDPVGDSGFKGDQVNGLVYVNVNAVLD